MAYNILIVDDSKIIRSVIKKTLEISGIPIGDIFEASNGLEGLTAMREHWIDLVFADLNMPVMNGLEMLDMMAQEKLIQKIPVLICSTEGSKTRIEELFKKGVRAFLRKPITPEVLRNVVREVMGDYDAS